MKFARLCFYGSNAWPDGCYFFFSQAQCRHTKKKSLHRIIELILLFAFEFLTEITLTFPSFSFQFPFCVLYRQSERSGCRETLKHIFFEDSGTEARQDRASFGTGSTECVVRVLSLT